MVNPQQKIDPEVLKHQKELIKDVSEEVRKHTPLIREFFNKSRITQQKTMSAQILFGVFILIVIALLALFDKLSGETIAGIVGVLLGYLMGTNRV